MSKKPMSQERQLIFDKTKGKCLYCGLDLTGIKWQADHFHPIIRHPEKGTCVYPKLDTIDNLFPSCAHVITLNLQTPLKVFVEVSKSSNVSYLNLVQV